MKRSATLSTTMPAITVPARASPVAYEIADKVASRITSGLRMIFSRRTGQPCRRSWATSFGPVVRARSSASVCVRPPGFVRKDWSNSSPSFPAASRTAGEMRMLWFFDFAGIAGPSVLGGGSARLETAVSAESINATVLLPASEVVIVPLTALRKLLQTLRSFVPESLNRIQERRFARRIVPKEHSHQRGKYKRHHDRQQADHCGPMREVRDQPRCRQPNHDPDNPTQQRQRHRFHEELREDVTCFSPHRLPQADLASPLGHRHQHDIHDSDAAHNQ